MPFDEYMQLRGDLMQFLLSVKLVALAGDSIGVVEMVNSIFIDHLEYLEASDSLATEFFLSAQ